MQKPVHEGGYTNAWDVNGKVRLSLFSLVKYWLNWLVIITPRYNFLCGCETCTISQDMQHDLNISRRVHIKTLKFDMNNMIDLSLQAAFKYRIELYESEINNSEGKPQYSRMWYACD